VAPKKLAEVMNTARLTWNLNIIADRIGQWLMTHGSDFLRESRAFIEKERERFYKQLANIRGFKPLQSRANFILVDINGFPLTAPELSRKLLSKGIVIRDCTSFGLTEHIRLAVLKREENQAFIQAVEQVVMEWGKETGKKSLKAAIKEGHVANSRINCEYYPCHFEGQDCTFCFCPFYPCEDLRTSGEYIPRESGSKVWSCMKCHIVHKPEVAHKILDELLKDPDVKKAWKHAVEPLL
jgi:threonine-phosphate decarboxylase